MNPPCKKIRDELAENGAELLEERAGMRRHLETCEGCAAFLRALEALDDRLSSLPSHDAPDEVVAATLAAVREGGSRVSPPAPAQAPRRYAGRPGLWLLGSGLAAGILLAVLTLPHWPGPLDRARRELAAGDLRSVATAIETYTADGNEAPQLAYRYDGRAGFDQGEVNRPGVAGFPGLGSSLSTLGKKDGAGTGAGDRDAPLDALARVRGGREGRAERGAAELEEDAPRVLFGVPKQAPAPRFATTQEIELRAGDLQMKARKAEERPRASESAAKEAVSQAETRQLPMANRRDLPDLMKLMPGVSFSDEGHGEDQMKVGSSLEASGPLPATRRAAAEAAAAAFLAERERTEGLPLREASGYWANTYVPGDPAMRLLDARLRARGRDAFRRPDGTPFRLDDTARTYRQPFDPPLGDALAVYLHSDRVSVDGPTRLLVQVGLQATESRAGRRPALNVGIVLDLRETPDPATAAAMRALVAAFAAAREPWDRFSLTLAGRPGGMVVPASSFRNGPLTLALDEALAASPPARTDVPRLDLPEAVRIVAEAVAGSGDPTAPLGASAVVLVTASSLQPNLDDLVEIAHTSAVAGIPMSVVGAGTRVRLPELDEFALAGQGSRRLLPSPGEAEALVDREIQAAARAVARAVRLRIRLAPGVHLVGVLGSRPLGEAAARRVREAERSVDLRLARNLGIQADRGEDEEGIQMVIPAFYAGDAHVVLLDVVADRPGAVADVTVRYKDLVHLRNGLARDNLTLGGRPGTPGPLERNVLKNLVARELAGRVRRAGLDLGRGDASSAREEIAGALLLLEGLRLRVEAWESDPEILADIGMLRDYLDLLDAGAGRDPAARAHLADSLRYAAFLKVTENPEAP